MNRLNAIPTLAVACAALFATGCLERKETIRVSHDGSSVLRVELKGDPTDFAEGDALPSAAARWAVIEQKTEVDKEGKRTEHRTAELAVPAGSALPDAYAAADDPARAVILRFPTTLTVEDRPDGRYYHLQRVYQHREEARYNTVRELHAGLFEDVKRLSDRDPADLTDEDRTRLVTAFKLAECGKQIEYVTAGTEPLRETWPQHYGLLARQAMVDHFEAIDVPAVVALLKRPAGPDRDAEINALGNRVISGGREAVRQTLVRLHVPDAELQRFLEAFDREQTRRTISEDLSDESWIVTVELPGEIVASNATRIAEGKAEWSFNGKVLHDRDHVLMVTSRLPRDTADAKAK